MSGTRPAPPPDPEGADVGDGRDDTADDDTADDDTAGDDTAGDPVCWLDQLCPECGAMPSGGGGAGPRRCWRCGS
ncbi:hypothetical protein [Pseudonocardia sp. NPDC049635]|uniref:hypothetical protein n=1 Tax=Pseudonocardia sp. NPDC049635 TaxID=3155506 RepID=UPI0033CA562A